MRLSGFSFLVAALFGLSACGLVSFDIPVNGEFVVEAGAQSEEVQNLDLPENFKKLRLEKTKEFKDAGFGMEDVDSIKLTSARLQVKTPGQDLSFIKTATFFVEAPGISKRSVGKISERPAPGQTSLKVELDDVDLKNFAMKDEMVLSAEAERDELDEDVIIELRAVFHVSI